jgi:hypothetical protein
VISKKTDRDFVQNQENRNHHKPRKQKPKVAFISSQKAESWKLQKTHDAKP